MSPGRALPIVTALTLAMSVSAHAATIQIIMENLVISPAEATRGDRLHHPAMNSRAISVIA